MALRDNYDSPGLNTGLAIAEIFSGFEMQMIANRKLILQNAIRAPDSFQSEVMSQFRAYREANGIAALNAENEAKRLVSAEIDKSFSVGVNTVDKAMAHYIQQGYTPPQEPENNNRVNLIKTIFTLSASSFVTGIIQYAQEAASRQLVAVSATVNPQADNLTEEVDRAQNLLLQKGIPGKQLINGVEKEMTAEAEFVMRDQSHKALQVSSGERRQEYGNSLVMVSAHPSSCPLCIPWQGQKLIDDVTALGSPDGKHELLSTALAAGLGHFNCRHTWIDFIPGFTKPDFYDYDKASKTETAKRYAVEQQQRYNERQIREWKRRTEGSLSENKVKYAEYKVREWQARQRALRDIADRQGVPFYRQYSREQLTEAKAATELTNRSSDNIIDTKQKLYNLPFDRVEHLKGKLSNETARNYYVEHVHKIADSIDKSQTIEEQAKQAFALRNDTRSFVRELMSDSQTAKNLDAEHANWTWEQIIERKKAKGLTDKEVFIDIVRTASTTNANVDAMFGIKRRGK